MNRRTLTVNVGMAGVAYCLRPQSIRTSGLGSCVGVVVYTAHVAALAHVMLPDSAMSSVLDVNPAKYADTAVPLLAETIHQRGYHGRKRAKIAGGAHMFPQLATVDPLLDIGTRNVAAVRRALRDENIPIMAEITGGHAGRTIEFFPADQSLSVRTIHGGTRFY
ncbi:chemotaxis protein CheD [Natribacillus halophilus]|uniref:Probable chemoreceptor glutamine deamidase CheD n=1 Tax=Natribacillus halophilus TaxID=549003 RepID=A0A1G8PQV1_9BACI|nr:hypothetical protein [Natribacillus halophilus]SDI94250.1 chemotaxis protein CheD [Natribacillus halophilus]